MIALTFLNSKLDGANKYSDTGVLSLNQDIVMAYDGFINYSVNLSGVAYCGYAVYINGVVRDSMGYVTAGQSVSISRSIYFHKGDTIKLQLNNVGSSGSGTFYFY